MEVFVGVSTMVLDKFILVHRPILLKENAIYFGPTPFRFFNIWFDMESFHEFVRNVSVPSTRYRIGLQNLRISQSPSRSNCITHKIINRPQPRVMILINNYVTNKILRK